jgi:putative addiction module killer protein
MKILEYNDANGRSPFKTWFDDLNVEAAVKVTVALTRMGLGNLSNAKSVGGGVLEFRIDFGPGYRVYFGQNGDELIILLGGGTKRGQQQDIAAAKGRWADYKTRTATLRRKDEPERAKSEARKTKKK